MIVLVLVVGLAGLLSSPDVPPVTIATWAQGGARGLPGDRRQRARRHQRDRHLRAALQQPDGSAQRILFSPQTIAGVRQPINAAQDFVLGPLAKLAPTDPALAAALAAYKAASARPAADMGQRVRQRGHEGDVSSTAAPSSPPPTTGRSRR